MSERVKVQRASFGQKYLDKYGSAVAPAPETNTGGSCTAAALLAIAAAEMRCKRKMNDGYTYGFGRPKYDAGTSSTPAEPAQPSTSLKYKIGDVVNFTGSVHYVSSSAANGSSCKPGKVKITAVYASGKHPYHAIAEAGGGSTAYGWVDAALVEKTQ